jgi:nitric oxide reductase NorQ protein
MNAPAEIPWYREVQHERATFEAAWRAQLPVLLKGPTGSGKTRLVEHMAARLGRPLVTVSCHDDTSALDLVGRYLLHGGETVWADGPVTRAVRAGAILYLDEIAEARSDVIVVIHPLADHRRQLYVERRDEIITAPEGFLLVVSFNPGYQRGLKELKPSTRQRFVSLHLGYPPAPVEREILIQEAGVDEALARKLVALGQKLRELDALGLAELPSTRLLVHAARLLRAGLPPRQACHVAIAETLTDDRDLIAAMDDLIALVL